MKINKKDYRPWNKGKKLSEEHKKNISEALSGKKHPLYGKKHSKESLKKMSLALSGKKHHQYGKRGNETISWKGGKIKDKDGYILISNRNHPCVNKEGYVREHRLIMEKHLGRYLTKEEVVHHIDFNRENNNINNLHLFTNLNEHMSYHHFLRKIIKEALKL